MSQLAAFYFPHNQQDKAVLICNTILQFLVFSARFSFRCFRKSFVGRGLPRRFLVLISAFYVLCSMFIFGCGLWPRWVNQCLKKSLRSQRPALRSEAK
jgi:hypothetical protein